MTAPLTWKPDHKRAVAAVRAIGIPKAPHKRKAWLLENEAWAEDVFADPVLRQAAFRVGRALFKARFPYITLLIAWRLSLKSPKAYLAFMGQVSDELKTNSLLQKERAELKAARAQAARTCPGPTVASRKFTPQELYTLVWFTPARLLAEELGISDVRIGKICKEHGIPKPYRGYWAKVEAGLRPRQTPLPARFRVSRAEIEIRGRA